METAGKLYSNRVIKRGRRASSFEVETLENEGLAFDMKCKVHERSELAEGHTFLTASRDPL
jgi:hypothetical protein